MKMFYALLGNALIVITKNSFVWFALTYWLYLQTQSVLSTAILGGAFMLISSLSSFWLGSVVDQYNKKKVLLLSGLVSLIFFSSALGLFLSTPIGLFTSITEVRLWLFSLLLLVGAIAGNVYSIAVPTLVTTMVPAEDRDRANGMFGTVMGISFTITSVASGLTLAYAGMVWVLITAVVFTAVGVAHLLTLELPEQSTQASSEKSEKKIDIAGTITAIRSIPGLFALIFFTTFNNFLGGVFMALMDAYGLTLVSVQVWGVLWGVLGTGFIIGGMLIAKYGLGSQPLKTLFRINLVTWTVCIFFTIQPSILLLAIGIFIWITLMPFIEATEQTIIQKVVPADRQGRVFGFAHSIEQAASPLTAFLIGPVAHFFFIPLMSTGGAGAELIGNWYGVGPGRGMALVFSITGIIGLIVTLIAMRSRPYKILAQRYSE